MADLGPSVLALAVAAGVAVLELITSSYPRTVYFIQGCKSLYAYALIYGLLGFGVALTFDTLVQQGALTIEGFGQSNAWIRAVALGVTVKALLHIRLFSVGIGDKSMPFGTETVVQLFEPWLLERIELHEFNSIRSFLQPREKKYTKVAEVRSVVLRNLPRSFSGSERVAFEVALKRPDRSATECMEMYLRRFGRANFERVFP